jgi:hypothetical protein
VHHFHRDLLRLSIRYLKIQQKNHISTYNIEISLHIFGRGQISPVHRSKPLPFLGRAVIPATEAGLSYVIVICLPRRIIAGVLLESSGFFFGYAGRKVVSATGLGEDEGGGES